jgi:sigma-E factor negative regulatory protein RseA
MKNQLSELVDGELSPDEAAAVLAGLKEKRELRQDWLIYHVIGDTLRGTPPVSADFTARFSERLTGEPTILAPQRTVFPGRPLLALSIAASVAAVAVVTWAAFEFNRTAAVNEAATNAAPAENLASALPGMNVNNYLIAHQEFAPSVAMQGIAPYVRTLHNTPVQDSAK